MSHHSAHPWDGDAGEKEEGERGRPASASHHLGKGDCAPSGDNNNQSVITRSSSSTANSRQAFSPSSLLEAAAQPTADKHSVAEEGN